MYLLPLPLQSFLVALAPQQSLHIGGLVRCLLIVVKILVIPLGNILCIAIFVITKKHQLSTPFLMIWVQVSMDEFPYNHKHIALLWLPCIDPILLLYYTL